MYDAVLDAVGNIPIKNGRALLKPSGRLALMAATLPQMLWPSRRVVSGSAAEKAGDIAFLLSLVASGQMQVVVDGVYRLDNIVSAHKRVEVRGKAGAVIVNFGELR